jgi:hypothetical protein
MIERLNQLRGQYVVLLINSYHLGYSIIKGIISTVGEDYVEIDTARKMVLVPVSMIATVSIDKR